MALQYTANHSSTEAVIMARGSLQSMENFNQPNQTYD